MQPEAAPSTLRQAIVAQILRHAAGEGETTTAVPGLRLLRTSSTAVVQRGMFRPSFCMVAQGEKLAQAGAGTTLRYGAGNFLASSIDMPMAGQVVAASRSRPYLAVWFDLSPHEVLSVLTDTPSFQGHLDFMVSARAATSSGCSCTSAS